MKEMEKILEEPAPGGSRGGAKGRHDDRRRREIASELVTDISFDCETHATELVTTKRRKLGFSSDLFVNGSAREGTEARSQTISNLDDQQLGQEGAFV